MNCNSTISVFDLFGATLHTRQVAVELLCAVENNPCESIELDFQKVEYISRSFADQFHSDKLNLVNRQQKNIIVINPNDEVLKMLQAVARTQFKENRDVKELPIYRYTDWQSLERFLLSI